MHRTLLVAFALVLVVALAAAHTAPSGEPDPPPARVRVGTFDPMPVVVAYYRSDLSAEHMRALHGAHAEAKAAGNAKEVKRLEAEGAALQELAHEQLEGKAALDNILERMRPRLDGVLADANVDLIVESRPVHARPDVRTVDVTDAMLRALKADAATLKVIEELKAKRAK